LNNALGGVHLETDCYSIKDLSYLALCQEYLTPDTIAQLKKKSIEHLEGATQSDRERLAIVFEEPEFKLDLEST